MPALKRRPLPASTAFLFAIAVLFSLAIPGPTARAEPPGPALNISSIECTDRGAVVHFVLVHNTYTEADLSAATLSFNYTVDNGPAQTATATFDKIAGKTAHFTATLNVTNGTISVTGGTLTVAATTIDLRNTMTQACGFGTLRICKALAAGTTAPPGTLFSFSVAGMGNFNVAPGSCVEVANVPVGEVVVDENVPAGYQVSAIQFLSGTGTTNVAGGSATATIVAGQTTVVQFTDRSAVGQLIICKALAPGAVAPPGTVFNFSVDGQTYTVPPGQCVIVGTFPAGFVSISELPNPDFQVVAVNYLQGTGTSNVAAGSTTADIVAGQTTRVEFVNGSAGAFIQVCKVLPAGVSGSFTFTSTSFPTLSLTVTGDAPVCGPIVPVTSGIVVITEALTAGFVLSGVQLNGPGSLVGITGTTATIQVPPGGPAQVTQVTFNNVPNQ